MVPLIHVDIDWKRVGMICGAILAAGAVIKGGVRALNAVDSVATDAKVEAQVAPVRHRVVRLETRVDSVRDSLEDARRRASIERDSLWRAMRRLDRGVNSILWVVCQRAGLAESHERCRSVR